MPVTYTVDSGARVIRVNAHGVFRGEDLIEYQRTVRARPEFAGFHEIFDLTEAVEIKYTSGRNVQDLAALAASMDEPKQTTYLAIVAPHPAAYGMARMYQTYREMVPQSNRVVRIFRSRAEAEHWMTYSLRERAPEAKPAAQPHTKRDSIL